MKPTVPRGKIDRDTLEKIEDDPAEWKEYDARRRSLEEKYGDKKVFNFINQQYRYNEAQKRPDRTAGNLYYNTAGEIEARDVSARRELSAEERRAKKPAGANDNTVFANWDSNGSAYSIAIIRKDGVNYGKGVILDTALFKGVKPRNWGKVLGDYIYKNMAGAQMTMYDNEGNPETVELARVNDRVKKTGAKNSHKVLDKMARQSRDNIRALSIVHMSELLEVSGNESRSGEHSHQWLDENGWILRTAIVQDVRGNVYEAQLNIADSKRGLILYEINNVRPLTGGNVSSTADSETVSGPDLLTSRKESDIERVSQPAGKVKGKASYAEERRDKNTGAKIRPGMDEEERARVLEGKRIQAAEYNPKNKVTAEEIRRLEGMYVSRAGTIFKRIAEKCGVFRTYRNEDVDIEFNYTRRGFNESKHKQKERGGTAEDFGKMLTALPQIIEGAVEIETQTDRYRGTVKQDDRLKEMHVLLGALRDGTDVIPVQLEIKEYLPESRQANKLYVSVTLTTKEAGIMPRLHASQNETLSVGTPASDIRISDILKIVNDPNGKFVSKITR